MRTDKYLAEFLGTLLLMMGVLASGGNPVVVGLALAVGIFFSAKISGGHLNPAVSIYFYAKKQLSLSELGTYIVAQLLGGFAGAYLGGFLTGRQLVGPSTSATAPGTAAIVGEILATAVLVWIVGSLAANGKGNLIPWAVGLWISAAAAFTATGAQANPAVSFGLMFTGKGVAEIGWLIVAQLAGTAIAVLVMAFFGKQKNS